MNDFTRCLILLMLVGCSGPRVQQNWSDPDISVDLSKLTKVLIVGYLNNQSCRSNVEEKISAILNGKGIPSYKYFGNSVEEEKLVDNRMKQEGFDGAVVMRLIETKERKHLVTGSYPAYYHRFETFFHASREQFYTNTYYTEGKSYYAEINIYSFIRDKLIWTGVTQTVDPAKEKDLIDAVGKTVYTHMKKNGFLVGETNNN